MRVVVTEKPSVARDLAQVLGANRRSEGCFEGAGLQITWCFGHMAELVDPASYDPAWKTWSTETLPMVPERFALRLREGVADHWKLLRALLRKADDVVNACDAGREGELIFRYVMELAEARKPVQRLWVSSMTDSAIRQAWSQLRPGERYDTLADAARCRSEADWLVGLNATRAMTCQVRKVGGSQLLSVGRVQTPTLAMIVRRDREIEAFVPETYWRVTARFQATAGDFGATFFQPAAAAAQKGAEAREREDEAPLPERLPSQALARAVAEAAADQRGQIEASNRRRSTEKPPLLYDLTALQRRANQRYGLSAARTLELAQALYERHKLLTYPRTDARHITPDQVPELPAVVEAVGQVPVYAPFAAPLLAAPIQPGRRVVDAAEVGDHHAILPTARDPRDARLNPDEKRIYDLVARRLLAALSPDALFDLAEIVVAVPPKGDLPPEITAPLRFRAKGRVRVQAGWQAVDPPPKRKEVDLPAVVDGDEAWARDPEVLEGQTRPPSPHSDASILGAMENAGKDLEDAELKRAMRSAGLGTPATRAAILDTLIKRQFIERAGKVLRATDRGRSLIDAVPVEELKSAELTGRWEARLTRVAEGQDSRERFMADVVARLHELIGEILASEPATPEIAAADSSPPLGDCPVCGKPVREKGRVYACDTDRACSFVIFKSVAKRDVSRRSATQLLKGGRTPVLKGFKSRQGKAFDAALVLKEDGTVGFEFPPREWEKGPPREGEKSAPAPKAAPPSAAPADLDGQPCPQCGQGHILRGHHAFGCSRWRQGCGWRQPFAG